MYIDFEHIISFLKEIQLKEEYYHFAERFYLLFQIANNVSQRITGKSSQITGDGSSASERLL
jgi:negative regulator of genetic competence, sporulation and motility